MPEYIRAFIYFALLSGLAILVAKPAVDSLVGARPIRTWIVTWFALGAALFLVQDLWIFLVASCAAILASSTRGQEKISIYVIALMAAPTFAFTLPGFGGINSLFYISAANAFAAVLLLSTRQWSVDAQGSPNRSRWPLRVLLCYFALVTVLHAREMNLTSVVRSSVAIALTSVVPFYAASRALSLGDCTRVVSALLFALAPLSMIGVFEVVRNWRLYQSAFAIWGDQASPFIYVQRDGMLRATGPTADPITFGFIFMCGIGLYLGVSNRVAGTKARVAIWILLVSGLLASLSRGPWLGTAVVLAVFAVTGARPLKSILKLVSIGAVAVFVTSLTPWGGRLIALLPFVGSVDEENVAYRFDLLNNAWIVILRNPLFGSVDYLSTPEMQAMIQGQGIIDVVNTYLGVTLRYGFVGLSLYALFFLVVLGSLWKAMRRVPDQGSDVAQICRALLATLCGALVTIFTVSSVAQIPYMLWLLSGLAVAATGLAREARTGGAFTADSAGERPLENNEIVTGSGSQSVRVR